MSVGRSAGRASSDGAPHAAVGFDTGHYPGDRTMQVWRRTSPYTWVGYYLRSPCRRDSSWAGTRARLARQGWGFAVVYVGRQAWAHDAPAHAATRGTGPPMTTAASPTLATTGCTAATLSAAPGHRDADDALAEARREGFPRGTAVFLDIERMDAVPDAMRDYYRAWVRRVAADSHYRPGLYVHVGNAAVIAADVRATLASVDGSADHPPAALWIAAPRASRDSAGSASMLDRLRPDVRQVTIDTTEAWGGIPLTIDVNAGAVASPGSHADRAADTLSHAATDARHPGHHELPTSSS